MSVTAMLNQSCEILRATPSATATGEVARAWVVQARTRVRLGGKARSPDRTTAGEPPCELVAWLPEGTDIRTHATHGHGDRLRLGGAEYECLAASASPGPLAVLIRRVPAGQEAEVSQ